MSPSTTSLPEKDDVDHYEIMEKDVEGRDLAINEDSPNAREEMAAYDRKMLFKLDMIIVPMMAMLYLIAFLDRANIGNARVAGLQKDLGLTDRQYQTAITVTYVPYICAEIPSNLLLRKVGPRILLPTLCLCWGVVATLQCLINSYEGLIAARFFLGMMEGGSFPGILLYMSSFYRRAELQVRIAGFYSAASMSGAFGGLLAAAISKMDGIGTLSGWQWIFCLEGMFTVLFAILAFFILPNNPQQVKTFTPEQAKHCAERLKLDLDLLDSEKVTLSKALSIYKSIHLWLMFILMFAYGTVLFGLAYFTPSIVQALGYSPIRTQLMTVPPFAVAFVATLTVAWIADHYQQRGLWALITGFTALAGLIIFYVGRRFAVRYAALFIVITGVYASGPCLMCWVPNNTAAHTRRAMAIATSFICTNSGGILSAWIFPRTDAPYYLFAGRFMLALIALGNIVIIAIILILRHANKRKEDPAYRERMLREVKDLSFAEQLDKLGDEHPDFKYIL